MRLGALRSLTATMKTGIPGPEGSLGKWQWADYNQALTELGNEVLGPEGMRVGTDWSYRFLRSRANSIEGGTTEVLKNIIAERVPRPAASSGEPAMNFDLNDEQQEIKSTAKEFLAALQAGEGPGARRAALI